MDWNNPLIYIVSGLALAGALWKLGNWMGSKDEFTKNVGEAIEEIRKDIKKIFDRLPPPKTTAESSPIRLTDFGRSISTELRVEAWAKRIAQQLVGQLRGQEPYQIQEFCFDFIKSNKYLEYEDIQQQVKKCVYNHGTTLDNVQDVLVVELRDALIEILPD